MKRGGQRGADTQMYTKKATKGSVQLQRKTNTEMYYLFYYKAIPRIILALESSGFIHKSNVTEL